MVHRVVVVAVESLLRDAVANDAEELTSLFLRSRARAMPWLASPHDAPSTRRWVQNVLLAEQHVRLPTTGARSSASPPLPASGSSTSMSTPTTRGALSAWRCSRTPDVSDPAAFGCTYSRATRLRSASTRLPASCWWSRATGAATRSRSRTAPTLGPLTAPAHRGQHPHGESSRSRWPGSPRPPAVCPAAGAERTGSSRSGIGLRARVCSGDVVLVARSGRLGAGC